MAHLLREGLNTLVSDGSPKDKNMKVRDMSTLFVESLKDLYSAETQLIEALPNVIEAASSKELKKAVKEHLGETKKQADRLKSILDELGEKPTGHKCLAMEGLIKEMNETIEDVVDPEVRDAALIGGGQKVEHYEISGYGTARTFARLLGYESHAETLQITLDEEYAADGKLGELAETMINERAAALGAGPPGTTPSGTAPRGTAA